MAEQLKVIVLTAFIFIFFTFTYTQFIKVEKYVSWATILIPDNKPENLGSFAGLASQFGLNMPSNTGQMDLSNPLLFPELIKSRSFAEKILDKQFFTKEYGEILPLIEILQAGNKTTESKKEQTITYAMSSLGNMIEFDYDPRNVISTLKVTTSEPEFSKNLAEAVLSELEALNRFYKIQTVNEKIAFIDQRILSVQDELQDSEGALKAFNEKNRQISSPALQLEQDRLGREVEIQKNIFLTLKQQLELSKIEEIQKKSIIQILDRPQIPLRPSNKNLIKNLLLAGITGIGLGIFFGFVRSYLNNSKMDDRKKIRRTKLFFRKKTKEFIFDQRVLVVIITLLIIGLPYYLGYESKNPIFFNRYSAKLMLVNTFYILFLISLIMLYFISKKNK